MNCYQCLLVVRFLHSHDSGKIRIKSEEIIYEEQDKMERTDNTDDSGFVNRVRTFPKADSAGVKL